MKNFIKCGSPLDAIAPAGGVVSGTGYVIGVAFGVAAATVAAGETFAYDVEGVFELPKLSTDVVAQYVLLYWDTGNARLTVTAGANKKVGYAEVAAGAGALTVYCRLTPTI